MDIYGLVKSFSFICIETYNFFYLDKSIYIYITWGYIPLAGYIYTMHILKLNILNKNNV